MVVFAVIAALLVFLILRQRTLGKEQKEQLLHSLRESYGSGKGRALTRERERLLRESVTDPGIDDITWSDLEMPSVFAQMNSCRCAAGEEELYARIRRGSASAEDLESWESLLQKLAADDGRREELTLLLHTLGFSGNRLFRQDLEKLTAAGAESFSVAPEILRDLLYLAGIPLILVRPLWGLAFYAVLMCIQVYTYFRGRTGLSEFYPSIGYLLRLVRFCEDASKHAGEGFAPELPALSEGPGELLALKKGALFVMYSGKFAMSSGPLELLVTYINILFHFDTIACRKILRGLSGQKRRILGVLRDTGRLDAAIAVCSYRAFLQNRHGTDGAGFCLPEFTEKPERTFCMHSAYHPLLESPVKQDLEISRGMILTGSNASGKSTFLRTCGLCALLAQTIHTCPAQRYTAPRFRIYSSISLKDSLSTGESYFMTEIRAMKRVLDASQIPGDPVFCMVDEVLRGTNTSERISAGAQILNDLAARGVLCFAATHDIELTELCKKAYENYHFEEILSGEDVRFTYLLQPGPSTGKNAILLLKKAGFSLT